MARKRGEAGASAPGGQYGLTGGAAVSSRLVRALSRNLIDVVFFDRRGEPAARLLPPDSNGPQKGAVRGVFQRQGVQAG